MGRNCFALGVWLLGFAILPAAAEPLVLAAAGKARCSVVVAPDADPAVKAAAGDLRDHLRRISGADVPVVAPGAAAQGAGIWVGCRPAGAALPGAVNPEDRQPVWPDGYYLIQTGDALLLLSPRPEGVANAVYGLLEDYLGCHWYTPGRLGEVVPRRRDLTVEIPGGAQVVKPAFEMRSPWYNGNASARMTPGEQRDMRLWLTRNRAGGVQGYTGHHWYTIYPKELQQQELGLAPLINGVRTPSGGEAQPCLSYPRAVDIAAAYFSRLFRDYPLLDYYSFTQNDTGVFCQCADCQQMGANNAARMLILTNRVAERVGREFPDKRITILPYAEAIEPPRELSAPNPNVLAVICSFSMEQLRPKTADLPFCNTYRERVAGWRPLLATMWSYDYMGWYPGPWTLFHRLQTDQDYYRQMGFTGLLPEYLDRNLGTDTYQWLSLRLAWDARLRVADLLDLFYREYFGAEAATMRAIYERFEEHMLAVGGTGEIMDVPRVYPRAMVEAARRAVAQAQARSGRGVVARRLQRDADCLRLTALFLDHQSTMADLRRGGSAEAGERARQAAEAYVAGVDALDGTLTVGKAARNTVVAPALQQLNDPGTSFTKAGPFEYVDDLNEGGRSYQALGREGFEFGTYGLELPAGARGEIIYEFRVAAGLSFARAYLQGLHFSLPRDGHNEIAVSADEGGTWQVAFRDVNVAGGTQEFDFSPLVRGQSRFRLRLSAQAGPDRALVMDHLSLRGLVE